MYHRGYKENLLGDSETNRAPNTLPIPTVPNHLLPFLPANSSILPQYPQGGGSRFRSQNAEFLPPQSLPEHMEGERLAVPVQGQAPFQQYKIY